MTIQEALRQLLNIDNLELHGIICKVTNVDGLTCECEPINGNAPIADVRLIADETESKYVLVPKVESIVVIQLINDNAGYVSMVSEVSEVLYKINDVYYSANSDGFLLKKGEDTLKQIITLIIQSVQQIVVLYGNNPDYEKLLQALNKTNNLLR
ncbi:MAG: hypothetical protein JSR11_03600 [Bacteroidetes bacterium]|nr:hypothetical protein [Bacteroidota bacterium]